MPTYDYRCSSCNHVFELFQSMSDSVKRTCPECRKRTLQRLIGTGAAILVGGTAAPASEQASSTTSDSDTDTTTETSSTSKPEETKTQTTSETTEKKTSGSTSTPTHEAREHRGVGNLVDAARRTRRESEAAKKTTKKTAKNAAKKTSAKPKKSAAPKSTRRTN